MILYTKQLKRLGINGIALFPFIILRDRDNTERGQTIRRHEMIHIAQQEEMLVLCLPLIAWAALLWSPWFWLFVPVNPFYFWYVGEYLVYRIKGWGHNGAYLNISFEKEAYDWQFDPGYISTRPLFHWTRYL